MLGEDGGNFIGTLKLFIFTPKQSIFHLFIIIICFCSKDRYQPCFTGNIVPQSHVITPLIRSNFLFFVFLYIYKRLKQQTSCQVQLLFSRQKSNLFPFLIFLEVPSTINHSLNQLLHCIRSPHHHGYQDERHLQKFQIHFPNLW